MSWAELVETLTEDRPSPCTVSDCAGKKCPHKSCTSDDAGDLGAWSPVELTTPQRKNEHVRALHALVLDGDGITAPQLEKLQQGLLGGSYVVHTTHRHRAASGAYFIRAVVQISRPVTAAEWPVFYPRAISLLGLDGICDPTCKDLSRLYFLPTHPSDEEFHSDVGEGEPLNVDAVLGQTPDPVAVPEFEVAPDAEAEEFVNLGKLVSSLSAYRRSRSRGTPSDKEKAVIIGRLLDGKPLAAPGGNADPPPIAPPEGLPQGRGHALMRAAAICVGYLPTSTPDEAYLEIFSRSLDAMCFGRPADREEMETHLTEKLRIGRDHRKKFDEENEARRETTRSYLVAAAEEREKLRKKALETSAPAEQSAETPAEDTSDGWINLLRKNVKGDSLLKTGLNAYLILKNESEMKDSFKWNEVSLKVDTFGMFAGVSDSVLSVRVANYLDEKWGLTLRADAVMQQVELVAWENRYDPLRDYLRSLKWNGESCLKNWLVRYANVVALPGEEALIDAIGMKWAIGGVARALNPGCKNDTVLVLEGEQGQRKTSLFETLGGEWYADMALAIGDKDSKMQVARSWVIEIPDLASLKKTGELNSIKAFFSTRIDSFRPPYGRGIITSPRRNIFAATTNDEQYLADSTGNRRFVCVRSQGTVDLQAMIRDRDQFWAEAVVLYDRHVNECTDKLNCGCWWFQGEEAKAIEGLAEQRMGDVPCELAICEWWNDMEPEKRPKKVTTNQVAKEALNFTQDRIAKWVLMDIGNALRKLKFKRTRSEINGAFVSVYVPPPVLLELPQSDEGKKKSMKFKPNLKIVS